MTRKRFTPEQAAEAVQEQFEFGQDMRSAVGDVLDEAGPTADRTGQTGADQAYVSAVMQDAIAAFETAAEPASGEYQEGGPAIQSAPLVTQHPQVSREGEIISLESGPDKQGPQVADQIVELTAQAATVGQEAGAELGRAFKEIEAANAGTPLDNALRRVSVQPPNLAQVTGPAMTNATQHPGADMADAVQSAGADMADAVQSTGSYTADTLQSAGTDMADAVQSAGAELADTAQKAGAEMAGAAQETGAELSDILQEAQGLVGGTTAEASAEVTRAVREIGAQAAQQAEQMTAQAMDTAERTYSQAANAVEDGLDEAGLIAREIAKVTAEFGEELGQTGRSVARQGGETVKEAGMNLAMAVRRFASAIGRMFTRR